MVLTPSTMIPLGSAAPDFTLPDAVSGRTLSLNELRSETATVIMFICNHCPYVKHIQNGLVELANDYLQKGVGFIAINSNDAINYPEDSFDKMKEVAKRFGYPFPYLFDESQEIAKTYKAACTPDFFIYDKNLNLAYRGQMDDSRPGNGQPVTGRDIRNALDELIKGNELSPNQVPSIGCNIKWRTTAQG